MKLLLFALVVLHVVDYCAANCIAPWRDVGGQCMVCSSALELGTLTYAAAQAACEANGGDLATIINSQQLADALTCGTDPWIGYVGNPNPHFQDGTPFVPATLPGVAQGVPGDDNCYFIDSLTQWSAEDGCNGNLPFVCSKPYGRGQCRTGWTYVTGRCMRCSSSLGLSSRGYLDAETACNNNDANLATLTTFQQAEFARLCGAGSFSWIGFRTSPSNTFTDGTIAVDIGQRLIINDSPNQCFVVRYENSLDWDDGTLCTTRVHFTCTQDPVSCPNLATVPPLSFVYFNTGDETPPTDKQWMDTVATYSCSAGYSLIGDTTRACQGDGTWSGSLPSCASTVNGAGQCRNGWTNVAGRCMRCSSSLGVYERSHLDAETTCNNNDANLATLTTVRQAEFARLCGEGKAFSWIGFLTSPKHMFIDGTSAVNIGQKVIINDHPNQCFVVHTNSKLDWDDVPSCNVAMPFTCTQDPTYPVSCQNPEAVSPLKVAFSNTGDGAPPTDKQWMDTVATYSCSAGYSLSGDTTRACQGDATWSGSMPSCASTGSGSCATVTQPSDSKVDYSSIKTSMGYYGVGTIASQRCPEGYMAAGSGRRKREKTHGSESCAALTQPSHGMIHYSSIATDAGAYVVGTIASQTCDDGYDVASGTGTRTCMATGTWNGSPISCDNGLVIGLAVGLGLMILGVIIGVLVSCFCRSEISRPPSRRPGYPRPRSGYSYSGVARIPQTL